MEFISYGCVPIWYWFTGYNYHTFKSIGILEFQYAKHTQKKSQNKYSKSIKIWFKRRWLVHDNKLFSPLYVSLLLYSKSLFSVKLGLVSMFKNVIFKSYWHTMHYDDSDILPSTSSLYQSYPEFYRDQCLS